MSRTSKVLMYQNILSLVETKTLNTHQIATQLQMNWETASNALDVLEGLQLVKQENKKYVLQSQLNESSLQSKTLFNLPLTKEQDKLFCELANRINELNKKPLHQTVLQNAVVQIIKRANIEHLPHGWYVSGPCTIHKLHDTSAYSATKKYDQFIIPVLEEFSRFPDVDDLLEHLYEKEHNELYLSKLNVTHLLVQVASEANNDIIKRELMRMMMYLYRNKFTEEEVSFFEYVMSSVCMLSNLPMDKFESLRMNILSAFTNAWNYVATLCMQKDLEQFYPNITSFTQPRIIVFKELLEPQLLELKSHWPTVKLNPKLEQFRASLAKKSQ